MAREGHLELTLPAIRADETLEVVVMIHGPEGTRTMLRDRLSGKSDAVYHRVREYVFKMDAEAEKKVV